MNWPFNKFPIKNFFSKCDQIQKLKKLLLQNVYLRNP